MFNKIGVFKIQREIEFRKVAKYHQNHAGIPIPYRKGNELL